MSHLLSDCSTSLTASCSASLIFCSISLFSSLVLRAVTSSLCLSCSASAALWASSLASSSAIWAFSASRSAVSSERSCREGRPIRKAYRIKLRESQSMNGILMGVKDNGLDLNTSAVHLKFMSGPYTFILLGLLGHKLQAGRERKKKKE